jgi:hypothetical protein
VSPGLALSIAVCSIAYSVGTRWVVALAEEAIEAKRTNREIAGPIQSIGEPFVAWRSRGEARKDCRDAGVVWWGMVVTAVLR